MPVRSPVVLAAGGGNPVNLPIIDIRDFLPAGFASGDDVAAEFQLAADQAAVSGGWVIVSPAYYGVASVALGSNTRWFNMPGTRYCYSGGAVINKECFSFNEFSAATYVEDCHFEGGEFDFTEIGGAVQGTHCIRQWGVKRWSVRNVKCTKSDWGTICHVSRGTGTYDLIAQQGEISNLRFVGSANSNFGCVQVNGVQGLDCWNLYGEMGVNLRLENDGQNFEVADVTCRNNRMITSLSGSRPVTVTVHNDNLRNVTIDGIYGEFTGDTGALCGLWNNLGASPIEGLRIRNFEGKNAKLFSPGQTLGEVVDQIVVENGLIRDITDAAEIAVHMPPNSIFRNVVARDNAGPGWEKLWGTDDSPSQEIVLEDCASIRNGGTAHIRLDISSAKVTLRRFRAYDDRHTHGATLGAEILTTNQAGLETDTTGWTNISNSTIARSTAVFNTGVASLEITVTAGGTNASASTTAGASGFAVTPGQVLAVGANVKTGGQTRRVRLEVRFADSGGSTISTVTGTYRMCDGDVWTPLSSGIVVPATAAFSALRVTVNGTGSQSAEKVYVDDLTVKVTDKAEQARIYGFWGSATKVKELVLEDCDIEYGPTSDFFNAQPNNIRVLNPRNKAVPTLGFDFQPTAGTEALAGFTRVRIGDNEYRLQLYNA